MTFIGEYVDGKNASMQNPFLLRNKNMESLSGVLKGDKMATIHLMLDVVINMFKLVAHLNIFMLQCDSMT